MTERKPPLPINMGGLMRCCMATIVDQAPPADESHEGDRLQCLYCKAWMVVLNGRWAWETGT